MSKQRTLSSAVSIKGVGLHTGKDVTLELQPAPVNHGFKFMRSDLEGTPSIEALANLVSTTDRGTALGQGESKIHTIEHVLAALTGLEIDNCLIVVDGPEMPIADGSSAPFIKAIESVGIVEQEEEKNYFELKEVIRYYDAENDIEIMALPADHYQVTVMVDYKTKVLGTQNAHLDKLSDFKEQISAARTFSFLHELEFLLDNGLIKGGDLNNAIVYVDRELDETSMAKLRKAFNKESVTVQANGTLDNLKLHFSNEAARHKLLDVVGDLSLVGRPLKARIIANKPGHKANTEFAKMLIQHIKKEESKVKVPHYDPNAIPLMDTVQIMNMLPHRPPFLLVDRIIEMSENHVIGVKAVTMNEPFFVGHFPGAPVMPGVLQIEAMAQVGGILALSSVPDPENYLTFFLKMDAVKFKHKVVPGDTLIFKLELTAPIRRGIISMRGQAFVGDKVASEAELTALISKEK